jgi:hypothetical protein
MINLLCWGAFDPIPAIVFGLVQGLVCPQNEFLRGLRSQVLDHADTHSHCTSAAQDVLLLQKGT